MEKEMEKKYKYIYICYTGGLSQQPAKRDDIENIMNEKRQWQVQSEVGFTSGFSD
jgi:hypothetical protein